MDSLFTGFDCPHAAIIQLSAACKQRTRGQNFEPDDTFCQVANFKRKSVIHVDQAMNIKKY